MFVSNSRALAVLSALTLSAGCVSEGKQKTPPPVGFDQAALESLPRIDRLVFADDGVPYLVRGMLGQVEQRIATVSDAERYMAATVDAVAAPFELSSASFAPVRVSTDVVGMTHIRYQQELNGLPVIGGELIVHLGYDGVVDSVTNDARAYPGVPAAPAIAEDEAVDIAVQSTLDGQSQQMATDLVYLRDDAARLARLAWRVEVIGRTELVIDRVFVDAISGAILERRSRVYTAKNRVVKDGNGQESIIAIFTAQTIGTEGSPPTGDPTAMAAYDNTGGMYECYSELFRRDSYDNMGATLTSIVHVTFQGTGNNAAWAGDTMLYGDGDGSFFSELAEAYDVTAHELTHGVISATANLAYMNESGALNEGWADIMAAVCEAWNDGEVTADTWLIGEDIFTPGMAGDALRYMGDPTADSALYPPELGGSRDFYADRYTGSEDNGGVHLNSGIANLAFKLLVTGGTHPQGKTDFNVSAMPIDKAGEIFLATLEDRMTSGTNFAQARVATEEAAAALYGDTEVAQVGLAWAAVGIGEPPVIDEVPPTVSIASPGDGDTVDAGFTVEVTAADDQGIAQVTLVIDGANVGTATSAPYAFQTSDTLSAGPHTVQAIASDGFNDASDQITVNIAATGCGGDEDCVGDETCQGGVCLPPDGSACTTDDDCPGNQTCEAGICENPEVQVPGDGVGGGCCSTTGTADNGALTTLLGLIGLAWLTRRRRRRRD